MSRAQQHAILCASGRTHQDPRTHMPVGGKLASLRLYALYLDGKHPGARRNPSPCGPHTVEAMRVMVATELP